MNTRNIIVTLVAISAALAVCILPMHKWQTEEAEISTFVQTTEASTTCPPSTAAGFEAHEVQEFDPTEVELVARTIWGEAEGVKDKAEQAAVAWCILNRVDESGKTIEEVVTAPHQFQGFYRVKGEVPERFLQLAEDVLRRWHLEKAGFEDVGRTLPSDYLFFIGFDGRNFFSTEWQAPDFWDWTLKSPY